MMLKFPAHRDRFFAPAVFFIILFSFFYSGSGLMAQQPEADNEARELRALIDSSRRERSDSLRFVVNNVFFDKLAAALHAAPAGEKVFDSLNIGQITSADGKVSLYNWNLQQNDGTNTYFMIIRLNQEARVIPMKPVNALQELPQETVFRNGDWPGGLFYRIIYRKEFKSGYYTLLGWDGFSRTTTRKTIDALSFDKNGNPVFGAPMFRTKEGIKNRVVSEYASRASFTQTYDKQRVNLSNVRKSQRKVNDEIIVIDRLVPMNETLEGQRWAYVPAGNMYDAYIFYRNLWSYVEDVEPRNPAPAVKEKSPKKPVNLDLFPPKQ